MNNYRVTIERRYRQITDVFAASVQEAKAELLRGKGLQSDEYDHEDNIVSIKCMTEEENDEQA
jgi:hypothetical protein